MTKVKESLAATPLYSSPQIFSRLSIMMFLQYFVQGAYLPVASVYVERSLGFTPLQVGIFSSALAVGPILTPFIFGQLVDRLFATERVMACCHLAGGVLMLILAYQTAVWPVIIIGTAYSVLYVPTMMLTNSLAFQHLKNSDMEFPWIRACGTLGYIVPAYLIEFWWLYDLKGDDLDKARSIVFIFSGIAGIVMGLYCFSLPHTPPDRRRERTYAPGIVMRMVRQRDFLVLIIVSFLIAIAHQFVLVWNSPFLRSILDAGDWGAYEQSLSSLGQICELGVLAILGLLIKRLGFKWTLMLGATAYLVRCLLFAMVFHLKLSPVEMLVLAGVGQTLHGFCFGCFLAVGFIYVDRIAPRDVRGSMQTLYGTFILSLGFFFGGLISGQIGETFTTTVPGGFERNWPGIWLSGAAICAVCIVLLGIFFPNRHFERSEEDA